jgi:hypothetical protein
MCEADTLHAIKQLIAQKNRFIGIPAPGMGLGGCHKHQKRVQAYAKVLKYHY